MLTGRPVILALDGTEGMEGRALFTLSALTFAGGWSAGVAIRMIDVTDDNVLLAAEALAWDEGIAVEIRRPGDEEERGSPLEGAGLYAGAAFRHARHMRLEEARRRGIPVLAAIQYPDPADALPPPPGEPDAAFDPRRFAAAIGRALRGRAGPVR
ncbi:hypothetical protein HL658_34915 [Azospirillum sp. RWY-5-1]|uniref:Universal stress protein n=1 Tax=Azospirillum oleiclasticum TaxID=2735135 RepID=A0ABX2TJ76_9PROT|nr:hypothetical protein [Azospirillum oleiclasticum]NYZ17765.1 hypothetical protein [Azospirillum oleiclasticum]NYZ24189.1 hypothetical protein [Azospirillum oleiclasticum]